MYEVQTILSLYERKVLDKQVCKETLEKLFKDYKSDLSKKDKERFTILISKYDFTELKQ